ncbi:hypothetical protein IPH25_02080 [bacterium]|nr:MAG: hypothetical protein IPG37_04210 [bacterium]QQR62212.1 MAG: hypothetical protein IPH25_02080 [bacterium]QQR63229.1 MAG: hypothetical protein IPH67_02015 [bacterium]
MKKTIALLLLLNATKIHSWTPFELLSLKGWYDMYKGVAKMSQTDDGKFFWQVAGLGRTLNDIFKFRQASDDIRKQQIEAQNLAFTHKTNIIQYLLTLKSIEKETSVKNDFTYITTFAKGANISILEASDRYELSQASLIPAANLTEKHACPAVAKTA